MEYRIRESSKSPGLGRKGVCLMSEVLRSVLRMLLQERKEEEEEEGEGSYYSRGIGHWQPCDVAPLTSSSSSSSSIGGAGAKMEPAAVVERRSRCQQVGEHTSS